MCAAFLLRPAKQVLRHCLLLHCLATMPLCIIMLFHSTFSAVRMHWAIKDVDSHRASMNPGLAAIGKWQWGNDGSRLENRIDRIGIPVQEEIYASTRWFGTDLCQYVPIRIAGYILYHPISSYIILYHPISSYIILYHPISSYIILYHPISTFLSCLYVFNHGSVWVCVVWLWQRISLVTACICFWNLPGRGGIAHETLQTSPTRVHPAMTLALRSFTPLVPLPPFQWHLPSGL